MNIFAAQRNNFIKKLVCRLLSAILCIIFVFCFVSCNSNGESSLDERPVIKVGSEDYPPFTDMDNSGNPTGIDIDVLREVFSRAGYGIELITINWEDRDAMLDSGEIDCVAGAFTMQGRENDYLWVGPYLNSNQVVAVNSGSGINSLQDLYGKSIAVQSSSSAETILLNHQNASVPSNIQVVSYEDNNLPFAALGCGYIDALVADEPVVAQYMKDYDTKFVILDEPLLHAGVGVAFSKNGDETLCAKLNELLKEMRKDGTLASIIKRYLDDADRYLGGDDIEE